VLLEEELEEANSAWPSLRG